jgi:hypothetical protein
MNDLKPNMHGLLNLGSMLHRLLDLRWRTPKLLNGLNYESKGENNERIMNWGTFHGSHQFGDREAC